MTGTGMRDAPAGRKAAMVASTPNTTGEGSPTMREADADEQALHQRGGGRAEHHRARDLAQVLQQLLRGARAPPE